MPVNSCNNILLIPLVSSSHKLSTLAELDDDILRWINNHYNCKSCQDVESVHTLLLRCAGYSCGSSYRFSSRQDDSGWFRSYLLSGTDQPECTTCHCPITVKHILVECRLLIMTMLATNISLLPLWRNVQDCWRT